MSWLGWVMMSVGSVAIGVMLGVVFSAAPLWLLLSFTAATMLVGLGGVLIGYYTK